MVNGTITTSDIATLRDILDLARPHPNLSPVDATFQVLRLLEPLLGCDGVSFQAMDSLTLALWHQQDMVDGEGAQYGPGEMEASEGDPLTELWERSWWSGTCSLIERTGAAVVTSDRSWYTEREVAEDPLNRELLHHVDELIVGHPVGPFRSLRILAPRTSGSPFAERELVLMRLLHPHLQPLLVAAASEQPVAAPALTPRQLEVLRLVRFGMPNRHVARALGISEGTVRKHLENAYERLGVHNRGEAVAAALDQDDVISRNVTLTTA
ncbi:regulatory protein, luxR family [Georgenia satyanarayanai]|uniref:Regulatory protein, luxR family n=1 Tax=Georgenia satyanarayanai TaxID=860221 RepID=A0A2Y9AR09_9MICO|nr:helix-turn-helix transcriptional regulator [Georgenia satyanarayanai]PYF96772.1 regulatory LuxR family protein [Georgenia satyanarayanai]SSA46515.1 regulatory protein, luxR family [Georgenia satyanarayanai]